MAQNFDAKSLKEQFNPEGSLLRKQQHRMTELLVEVDRICKKHHIPYWLSSGTLLGAVRHGGYIPWDDDLDIEMLRKDYLRLMKILPQELPQHMVLQNHDTDPNYFFTFAKVRDTRSFLSEVNHYDRIFKYRGIYIDIFPFEKNPPLLHWISCRAHGFIYKILKNPRYTDQQVCAKVNRIYRFNHAFTFPVLRFLSRLCPTKLVCYGLGVQFNDPRHPTDIFPLTTLNFEGHPMPVPRDSHMYLTRKFGHYMRLPDTSKLELHVDQLDIFD